MPLRSTSRACAVGPVGEVRAGRRVGPTATTTAPAARSSLHPDGSRRSSCSSVAGLLPAIFFIFSRAQCDAAAKACVDAGLDLVDAGERTAIRAIIDARLGGLEQADLDVLGFRQFVSQLEAGVAAHHAGMVPPMKEVVEACFVEGLVKVVFATETLAVGINMPARTVVIEKLTKFTGEHHERLTPGEYTQLTGRAGRRGIDDLGTAVVLWSPWVRFDEVAELAGSSSFHLRSAFRPTYNMAANLIRTYSSDEAHHLLNLSFAQYQADRDVVRLGGSARTPACGGRRAPGAGAQRLRRHRRVPPAPRSGTRPAHRRSGGTTRGRSTTPWRRCGRARRSTSPRAPTRGRRPSWHPRIARTGLRLTVITRSAKSLYLTAEDFDDPPRRVGSIALPHTYAPNRKEYRNDVARRLRAMKADPAPSTKRRPSQRRAWPTSIRSHAIRICAERLNAAARRIGSSARSPISSDG